MHRAFNRFAWAMVWILIDVRILFFDMLPDLVGYALLWNAIHRASQVRKEYSHALPYAIALTFLSTADLLPLLPSSGRDGIISIPLLTYGSLVQFLMLAMVCRFLDAARNHAAEHGAVALAHALRNRARLYFLLSSVSMLLAPFLIHLPGYDSQYLSILIITLGSISFLLLFFTGRRAAKELL
ncbi:hypothetical protein [Paenibacillus silviterrae]|uniref:hypothetical protein n=1 Tax=Paenibacillus silviterrae TaxID=3242194 RepID=UPI002543C75E|nr:hypothetical protein [Paenibacillus chinjuensis]